MTGTCMVSRQTLPVVQRDVVYVGIHLEGISYGRTYVCQKPSTVIFKNIDAGFFMHRINQLLYLARTIQAFWNRKGGGAVLRCAQPQRIASHKASTAHLKRRPPQPVTALPFPTISLAGETKNISRKGILVKSVSTQSKSSFVHSAASR
jgi:hypothetical protein